MKKVLVTNIDYDTDGKDIDLPKSLYINIPENIQEENLEDFLSDEISNITGWCHNGFDWKIEI